MKRKSFYSTRFFWLIFSPVILIVIGVGWWGGTQLTAAMSIRHRIAELREAGQPYDELSLTKQLFDSSSHEKSGDWFEVMYPIGNVTWAGYKAAVPLMPNLYTEELAGVDKPDELREFGQRLDRELLNNAQPLLEQLRQLTQTPGIVWIPIVVDERNQLGIRNSLAANGIVGIASTLPAMEFVVASREGEYNRAIQALKIESGCLTAFDWRTSITGDSFRLDQLAKQYQRIRETLSRGSWTDNQLQKLSEIVGPMPDVASRWRSVFVSERAMVLGEMKADEMWFGREFEIYFGPSRKGRKTVSIHATQLKSFIDLLDQLVEIGDDGYEGLEARANQSLRFAGTPPDCFPETVWIFISYAPSLQATETQRRLTVTAIATYRYRHAKNKWPQSLDDLRELGLSPQDWTAVDDGTFDYKVDVDSDTLTINNELFSWQTESTND